MAIDIDHERKTVSYFGKPLDLSRYDRIAARFADSPAWSINRASSACGSPGDDGMIGAGFPGLTISA